VSTRGPKPLPTRLKVVRGTLRKDRANPREPAVTPEIPTCPDELSPAAKKEWERIAPELAGLGLLAGIDRSALALYAEAYARWLDAIQALQRYGTVVKSPNGFPRSSRRTSHSRTRRASRCACCSRSSG
jgi:P27 family predicted phage terminase small subunit